MTKWINIQHYKGRDLPIQINIDGLSIYKSRNLQLWQILGMLKVLDIKTKPFIIGLYLGSKNHQLNT